ncbi:MAG: hypothetical protein MAG453_01480 [Calditrichaeota bacterium]|nr:hypothetical protein [Calditrichota bacterium]
MFRYERDEHRQILLLVVHGPQDGWDAQLMRIEWPRITAGTDDSWSFILDLGDYNGPHGYAEREQRKLAKLIFAAVFSHKLVVLAPHDRVNEPFIAGVPFEQHPDFISAWRAAGGDPRNETIPPPVDGSHYPAMNPPPRYPV